MFSVIIPVYNRVSLLKRAVASVLAQTYQEFEIIIVDDGSTVPVRESLNDIISPKIKYIKTTNMGAAVARNVGLALAEMEWIAFLDSDDVWLPTKLATVNDNIRVHGSDCCYYSGFRFIDEGSGKMIRESIEIPPENFTDALKTGNPIHVLPSVVVQRKTVLQAGGFDKNFKARQDVDLYMRLSLITKFRYIPEVLCEISMNATDKISANPQNRLQGFILYYYKHLSLFNFSNRSYLAKRIVYYAFKARKWVTLLRFSLLAIPSIVFKIK